MMCGTESFANIHPKPKKVTTSSEAFAKLKALIAASPIHSFHAANPGTLQSPETLTGTEIGMLLFGVTYGI